MEEGGADAEEAMEAGNGIALKWKKREAEAGGADAEEALKAGNGIALK